MNHQRLRAFVLLLVLLMPVLAGCSGESKPTAPPGCEDAPRPIVFVHGMMGGGDQFAKTAMRFSSNGYCPEYLRAFDWNTLSLDVQGNSEALASFIDAVLEETGADQIDLIGHSMGGGLSYLYLADEENAGKVAHYVHAASFCDGGSSEFARLFGNKGFAFPASVPLLVLSSDEDTVVGPCTIAGAQNQDVDGADHLQIVTLPQVFEAIYRFINDAQSPVTPDIVPTERVTLAGKALTFGTNLPLVGASVEVYSVDPLSGERQKSEPDARFSASADGSWGPFQADPATYYEFVVFEEQGRPFHYYRLPFPRSNPLVYLRVLRENDFLLNRILGEIPYDDHSSILVLFSADQALYHSRDSATVNGAELTTPAMAPPPPDRASTIAIFILDVNGNGQTDGGPVAGPLAEFPFLQQYDAFLDASSRQPVVLTLNGKTLRTPTWKAASEGVTIVVFD